MIVAIDGPAGSGKSTIAKLVAQELGYHYLDTGAMYRAVTYRALQKGISTTDVDALEHSALHDRIAFEHEAGVSLPTAVLIAGEDVTREIRSPEVDAQVSVVSAYPGVRDALVKQQRAIATGLNTVMEGRDIGTVVFPDAEVKVFLTASPKERARRRASQNARRGVGDTDEHRILKSIIERDANDSSRETSPLTAAPDAVSIDTSDRSIEDVVQQVVALVHAMRTQE